MKRFSIFSVAVIIILATGAAANSDVLYSTFGPGQTFSSTDFYIIGTTLTQKVASPFTLTFDATLDSIDFAAAYISDTNQITVELVQDLLTESVIESFDFTNILTTTAAIYTANSIIHPLLTASTQYWVVLTALDLFETSAKWYGNDQIEEGVGLNNFASSDLWYFESSFITPAFDVNGTAVPEPATMLLLGCSLIGLLGIGRKIKR